MNRRIVIAASMVMALAISAAPAVHASPVAVKSPVFAKFGKTKMVSFSLRNDSQSTITVMAGSTALKLEPGKTVDTKVAVGDKVTMQDGSSAIPAGTVLASVTSDTGGTTIVVR